MKNILVLGGAGYIGSHTCFDLHRNGYLPIVYDDLSNGHREFVRWGPFEEGDIRDRARLTSVFDRYKPEATILFAGLIEVAASIKDPVAFFDVNVGGVLQVVAAAKETGCKNIVFSSSCATYGQPIQVPMSEDHTQKPINPYGTSKLIGEKILKDCVQHDGFSSVILRYFNAAGACPEQGLGEWHDPESHVLPLAIDVALGGRSSFSINGQDYETRDGTCVRDFVHVMDLAEAHTKAVSFLLKGEKFAEINLGTGSGTTVEELLAEVGRLSERPLPVAYGPRRAGDAPVLVADNSRARDVLGWAPKRDLREIVESAWKWHAARRI